MANAVGGIVAATMANGMDPDWWGRAACRTLPPEWFGHDRDAFDPAEEPWEIDPRARHACEVLCPVRPECFGYAIGDPDLRGTWAATSWHHRRQLRRVRRRAACTGCGSTTTVVMAGLQFCVGCGLSWRIPTDDTDPPTGEAGGSAGTD